jgi:large subunit ribosomal protein L9
MTKVILTHEVSGLGRAGDVVDVKNGYARNYLLPQGYAVSWSQGGQKQVDQIRHAREAKALATHEEAVSLKDILEKGPIVIRQRAGAEGRLFGSVTRQAIEDAVSEAGLGSIDHRTIDIPQAIKSVGRYEATVNLRDGVVATLAIQVVAAK